MSDAYKHGLIVPVVQLATVIPQRDIPDAAHYIRLLFERQMLEQARILEQVAQSCTPSGVPGCKEYSQRDGLPQLVPAHGLIGIWDGVNDDGKHMAIAINPLRRDDLIKSLAIIKAQRLSEPARQVAGAIKTLRDNQWPELEFTTLRDDPDRKVWRLDSIGKPRLFIYLGNWISEDDLSFLRRSGANVTNDRFIFIVIDQSLPNIHQVLLNSVKLWQRASITAIIITAKEPMLYQLQREEHPLVSAIAGMLEGAHLEASPPVTPAPGPIPPPPPTPPAPNVCLGGLMLGDEVSEGELKELVKQSDLTEDERREKLSYRGSLTYPLVTATTHTAIFGTTGSGKSVTTKCLVRELVRHQIPVTIIDWHDEYVDLVRELGGIVAVPPTATTKPGSGEIPFTWNVLDPRFYSPEVTPEIIEDYVGIVVELFGHNDLMELSEAMKGGLTEALKLAYEKSETPTFEEVLALLQDVPIPPATANALHRRLKRFSGGSLGSIFSRETSFDPQSMFSKVMDVRVKHLTADHQSAVGLLTFFLLRQAVSYFKRMGEVDSQAAVRHVIIIDEAPMVIGSNPKVEGEVVRMLQEVRKFGEGLILVCRNPGISDDILRETNQKIAHKLDVQKDVASVASMLGLGSEGRALLRSLPRGVAFARIGGNPTALVRVKVG